MATDQCCHPRPLLLPVQGEKVSSHEELMCNYFAQPDALAVRPSAAQCSAAGHRVAHSCPFVPARWLSAAKSQSGPLRPAPQKGPGGPGTACSARVCARAHCGRRAAERPLSRTAARIVQWQETVTGDPIPNAEPHFSAELACMNCLLRWPLAQVGKDAATLRAEGVPEHLVSHKTFSGGSKSVLDGLRALLAAQLAGSLAGWLASAGCAPPKPRSHCRARLPGRRCSQATGLR